MYIFCFISVCLDYVLLETARKHFSALEPSKAEADSRESGNLSGPKATKRIKQEARRKTRKADLGQEPVLRSGNTKPSHPPNPAPPPPKPPTPREGMKTGKRAQNQSVYIYILLMAKCICIRVLMYICVLYACLPLNFV